jgi:hypothetical protein
VQIASGDVSARRLIVSCPARYFFSGQFVLTQQRHTEEIRADAGLPDKHFEVFCKKFISAGFFVRMQRIVPYLIQSCIEPNTTGFLHGHI